MNRNQIINQIKDHCTKEYLTITDWVHDIHHIRTVVFYGKKLAKMERLSATNAMLVEIACWLHDLGRLKEVEDPGFGKSSHGEYSYQMSKELLKPFRPQLGTEGMYKVLQAVREHNLPQLIHKDNIVGKILVDADRGSGIRVDGIFKMLSFRETIKCEPVYVQTKAREMLPDLLLEIRQNGTKDIALEQIGFLKDWYYGNSSQNGTGVFVSPLHTDSARRLFKKGMGEIEKFEREIMFLE